MPTLRGDLHVREALTVLRDAGVPMGVVLGPGGKPAGLVTPKDLIEPLTGPLAAW
jgi:CBS domain containing-hemolysin-like protein